MRNMTSSQLSRREFLKMLGTTGTSLLFGIYLSGCDQALSSEQPDRTPVTPSLPAGVVDPNLYLEIDNFGKTTITAFLSEMGQGIRTAIAMIIAEELDADWDSIEIKQAPASGSYGNQVAAGSRSVSHVFVNMRLVGALVRQLLINAAASKWEIDPEGCTTDSGTILHPNGKDTFSYGDVIEIASGLALPGQGEFSLKEEQDFRIIGSDKHHLDAPKIVTGTAKYGIDTKQPDMVYAALARCPFPYGTLASYDDSKALTVTGVQSVVAIDNWVAVVAANTWAAFKGRDALEVNWEGGDTEISSASIRAALAERAPAPGSAEDGQMDAVYEFPFQAHLTMEPMNCTAHVHGDTCEIWAPTQSPQNVQRMVQGALHLSPGAVTVNVTLLGGGFGRRLETDFAIEAAKVSQALELPVQVVWTRADDIQHDYYHPLHYIYVRGDIEGISKPIVSQYEGKGVIQTGDWRAIDHHPEAYARQSFIDEIAWEQGIDPLEFRRELYSGRSLDVIELAASKAGWGSSLPDGWGRGMAYQDTWGTHVAMVAEVEITSSAIRVCKVICAVDCGIAVNPDTIAAQIEGSIAFGLTAALKGGVTVEGGRILESNFDDCPILQINEMPLVEVYLIPSNLPPTGVGEVGVPPIAPAVANAVFNATGIRVRHLPITVEDLQ
jgi:isoquinoline 1-oxidoreductase beta subunit